MNENILKKLNEYQGDLILSPYSFDQAVGGALYVMGMSDKKPFMDPTDGVEEFNNWCSEQKISQIECRAKEVFKDDITKVDFSDKIKVTDKVNNDCNEKTHGMIPSIITGDDIDKDLVGIVLNTIYLNQKWFFKREKLDKFMFAGKETEGMESKSTESVSIFWYNSGPLVTMFLKKGINFHVFMPKDITHGLTEKDVKFITNYISHEHSTIKAIIRMPFIKTDGELSCEYKDEFDNRIKVKQKAKIICDDEGVEASAATAVLCITGCCFTQKEEIFEINLDKPFFFFIEKDGKLFFVGKKIGL